MEKERTEQESEEGKKYEVGKWTKRGTDVRGEKTMEKGNMQKEKKKRGEGSR